MNESDLPLTAVPRDIDELNEMVVETIEARWHDRPTERGPGLYSMWFLAFEVLISTDYDPPLVEVSGALVTGITDLEAAYVNANLLNVGFPHYKFTIEEDALVVREHVQAMPFVPDHLYVVLSSLTDLADDLGSDFARTFGGKPTS